MIPALCDACRHWRGEATCSSFPSGIPEGILRYGSDHRSSRDGEPPFELDPAKQEAYDLWLRYRPKVPFECVK
jgi:hypothetical protein